MNPPHLRHAEARLLVDYLLPEQQAAFGHLLDCPACRQLAGILLSPPLPPSLETGPVGAAGADVWASLAAARLKAAERLAAERSVAEPAFAALLAAGPAERLRRVREEAHFRTVAVAGLLLEKSHAAIAAEAPAEAEDLALFAALILAEIERDAEPPAFLGELAVCAWGLVARASWEAKRWDTVMVALGQAEKLLAESGHGARHLGFGRAEEAFREAEHRAAQALVRLAQAVEQLVDHLAPESQVPDPVSHGEGS